jgi:hypothetical protein
LSRVWVAVGREATEDDIIEILNQVVEPDRVFHVYTASQEMKENHGVWYIERKIAVGVTLILCTQRWETVEDERKQVETVREYHLGKINHRGLGETLAHLSKTFYWVDMLGTIREVIGSNTREHRERHP